MNSERAVESGKQPDFVAFIQRPLFLLGVVVIAWVLYSARQVVVTGLTAVVLAVFLADDPPLYRKAIVSVFPVSMRPRASLVLDACARGLWRWLLGQAFAMALICLFTTAGLYLIQMEHALTLGLIAELLQFIPYLGPYLSAIPAVMVAVTVSPGMVLWVTLLYLVVHLVESNLVTPFVFQNRANLPPALRSFPPSCLAWCSDHWGSWSPRLFPCFCWCCTRNSTRRMFSGWIFARQGRRAISGLASNGAWSKVQWPARQIPGWPMGLRTADHPRDI